MEKTVLVTGGAGYVGSHVCKALAGQGYLPIALDTLERGQASRVQWGPLEVGSAGARGDVLDAMLRHGCESVIHVAAYAFVGESAERPARYFANNLVTALETFDAAREAGARAFVFTSTCSVYGDPGLAPVLETEPLRPLSPYGEAKAIAERELSKMAAKFDIPLVNLRLFNAVGADPNGAIGESEYVAYGRLVPDALRAMRERRPLTLNGRNHDTPDGTPIRDYVHVDDIAKAHVLAVQHALAGGSLTCNVASGHGHSVREVLDMLRSVSASALAENWNEKRPGDPACIIGNPDRAEQVLGWRPAWSLRDALTHAWMWSQVGRNQATP